MGAPWEGVVEIPEGTEGEYSIEHFTRPAGKIERSNLRTAMMGGQYDSPLTFDHETIWHRLKYEGGVWMTDLPIEQEQHDQELNPVVDGAVLIGGLGLGYAVNALAAREDVEHITVVEISPEVVKLVGPHIKDPEDKVEIVTADLFEYLKGGGDLRGFDWAFYDIWQSDGETEFHTTVVPLRLLSAELNIEDRQMICWNENVMRGQLAQSLQSGWIMKDMVHPGLDRKVTLEERTKKQDDIYIDWATEFYQACVDGHITDENVMKMAGIYSGTYGRPGWEELWQRFLKDDPDITTGPWRSQ